MKRAPAILAALVLVAILLALGWQLARPSREPLIGSWILTRKAAAFPGIAPQNYTFHDGGSCWYSTPGWGGPTFSSWKPVPGPLYEVTPRLLEIIGQEYPLPGRYVSRAHLRDAHYQQALATNALRVSPESARARLYRVEMPMGHQNLILENGRLTPEKYPSAGLYKRSGTWFTRAWDRLRGIRRL